MAFDEFAGKNKRPKADIVDIMKNYMANKSFSRGIEQVTAEASMVFVGNTSHDVAYMINFSGLFEDLPTVYHDPAFIDRIHAYIPGWEMDIIRGDMFSSDFGFIVDYLAEALRHTRALDYSGLYRNHFELSDTLSARDKDGIHKTFSGLMKIIFPNKEATPEEIAEILEFCLEMRKRVKDSLYRIGETFSRVQFAYRPIGGGSWVNVETLEEIDFPATYHARDLVPLDGDQAEDAVIVAETALFEGHREFRENQRGVSFDTLFGDYLKGARRIEIIDPYIRSFHQCRNLMELLEVALRNFDYKAPSLEVHLVTGPDDYDVAKQRDYLDQIAEAMAPQGLDFTYEIDTSGSIHARHLKIDDSWDILLDRGLDIFQKFDSGNAFAIENRMPEMRRVRQFEVTYMKRD